MKYLSVLALCTGIFFVSCQKDGNSSADSADSASLPKVEAPDREPAKWTFLTADYFHYTYIDRIGETIPKSDYIGRWIDLKDDWTYEGGFFEETNTVGTWDYNHETKVFNIIPSDGNKRSEWRLLHNNDRVVMAGTKTYGDNPFQVRWNRFPEKPAKAAE